MFSEEQLEALKVKGDKGEQGTQIYHMAPDSMFDTMPDYLEVGESFETCIIKDYYQSRNPMAGDIVIIEAELPNTKGQTKAIGFISDVLYCDTNKTHWEVSVVVVSFLQGANGKDGLTTSIRVKEAIYEQVNGEIDLTEFVENTIDSRIDNVASGVNAITQGLVSVPKAEYADEAKQASRADYADEAYSAYQAKLADEADSAGYAVSALADANRNKIHTTYATKKELRTDVSELQLSLDHIAKELSDGTLVVGEAVNAGYAFEAKYAMEAGYAIRDERSNIIHETYVPITTLNSYYTKAQADAAFMTQAEVDARVNEVIAGAVDGDNLTNLTELVTYLNTHGAEAAKMSEAITTLEATVKEHTHEQYLTKADLEGYSKFSGSYDDLTNKPEIPSIEGLATEDFVREEIKNSGHMTIADLQIGENFTTDIKVGHLEAGFEVKSTMTFGELLKRILRCEHD